MNLAVRRTSKPHVTIEYLEPDFAALFLNGLRGLAPDGVLNTGYHGRELARNSAIGELALATGLRLQEFTHLLSYEIPALPSTPTVVPIRFPVPSGIIVDATAAITVTASARRGNTVTGINTCVTPRPVHRDRRGHNRTGPSGPRRCRGPPPTRQHTAARRAAELARRHPACARPHRPLRLQARTDGPPTDSGQRHRQGRRLQRREHRAAPAPQRPNADTTGRPTGHRQCRIATPMLASEHPMPVTGVRNVAGVMHVDRRPRRWSPGVWLHELMPPSWLAMRSNADPGATDMPTHASSTGSPVC